MDLSKMASSASDYINNANLYDLVHLQKRHAQ